ncbi:hypothetical protein N0V93_006098 [Gnomoniopsis smithogilvyi]|uniref:Uncharacterized protein n=1 Tax=Gnomoniopsis smithogilvyi TaxID=1191159 RepID=A0A9W9CUE8_9PEZI|nr:hypothetical protein N0V93_006098 [Gnomoniopsis smithogilvyi]
MFGAVTIAALTPFLLGFAGASPAPVRSRFDFFISLLVPNFPVPLHVPWPDISPASIQSPDVSPKVTVLDKSSSALTALGDGMDYDFACNPYNDAVCYKRWWDYYRYCHPYDRKCYRDCDTYDDYQGHCKNWDSAYGKCYDKCYYDKDSCEKYDDCEKDDYGNDDSCYKKKHKETYCPPRYDENYDEDCYHEPPEDYCKPYDYDCHRKQPDYGKPDDGEPDNGKDDDEYKCNPSKDKDCYPGYPDYPDHGDGHDEQPQEPTGHVIVKFYNKKKGLLYEEKVWPNGEELYTEQKEEYVEYIKYYTEKEDQDVRCLPMKNWFPWNPLAINSYAEKDEYGYQVRSLELKKPQPVEVIRCDFP